MNNEEKQLLLKDLCERLPYGVNVSFELDTSYDTCYDSVVQKSRFEGELFGFNADYGVQVIPATEDEDLLTYLHEQMDAEPLSVEDIKPYLRPMSSMTEEELKEFRACHCVYDLHPDFQPMMCNIANEQNMFDWLNKKMFDYRGLIPMGIAIEAPEGMYNIK